MTVTSFEPRTGAVAGSVAETGRADVDAAVARAAAAAAAVAAAPPAERRSWLYAVAEALQANADELVTLANRETALGVVRLTGEVTRAADQLRFYADVAAEGSYLGVTEDRPTGAFPRLVRVNRPIGPVAVFGASNFPFAFGVLGNDTGSALAAGCPVLVKAHPAHVLLSARLGQLAREALAAAGAPDGTFGLVVGFDAGTRLVEADPVAAVAFTGSQAGGLALWRLANERARVIPVYAEMGTVNPVVVTASAAQRMAEIATGFVGSFTLGSGQFCTKPGLLLAPAGSGAAKAVGDALVDAEVDPVMLTRGIAESTAAGVRALVDAGAKVERVVPGSGSGWAADATVLRAEVADLLPGSRLLEECFGPVAVVVEYHDADELDEALSVLQGALAGSVVSAGADDPDAADLVARLAGFVGRVVVDGYPTGVAFSWAQQHGGPWPATSAPSTTSVGAAALGRFVRPVTYQGVADSWLPAAAQAANPWSVPRRVDGVPVAPEGSS